MKKDSKTQLWMLHCTHEATQRVSCIDDLAVIGPSLESRRVTDLQVAALKIQHEGLGLRV